MALETRLIEDIEAYVDTAVGSKNANVQIQDEGVNLGSPGTVDTIDFVGAGVTASRASNKVTITIAGGGASTWGGIGGTLSDQTDLQSALDAKVDDSTLNESIDDRVAALLVAGSNVTLTYNDGANTLTIAASGGGGGSLDDALAAVIAFG